MSEIPSQARMVPMDGGESELDLRKYLAVIRKHKWAILGMGLLAALLGFYLALRAVPIYQGSARLQVERDTVGAAFADAVARYYYNAEFYKTQYELIRSWGVAEMAAEKLDLLEDAGQGRAATRGFQWRDWLPDWFVSNPPRLTSNEVRANRIKQLQLSLRVNPIEGSQLAQITVEHTDPVEAARWANAIAESYIEFLKDKSLENLETDQNWYASRLEQAKEELDQANRALQQFYERQGLLQTAEGADSIHYQRLQVALEGQVEAQSQRQRLERIYRDIINAREGEGSLETISALESRGVVRGLENAVVAARTAVSELSQRYGPRHPRMIEAQTVLDNARAEYHRELEDVADSVLADYRRAQSAEATYTARVEEAKEEIRAIDRNRAERQKLEDAAASAKTLFEQIQTGERTAGMLGSGTQKPNVTIIERARPVYTPVRPNKRRMVLLAALLGLMLGVGLAFLLEHLDNTFRGAPEVEDKLGLPLLGSMPKLKIKPGEELAPMREFSQSSNSTFSESVRSIRTGILLSSLDRECSVIVVTSSLPGEGKTTLSTNLAYALGHMKNTLLIDADMRRPMVGKVHGEERKKPGLSSYVTQEAALEDCVTQVENSQLTILRSGVVPPNPLELLGSRRFEEVMHELRGKYDFIVLDCAPALAVSDALMLSRLVDGVLYVVKADSTPHQAAEEGVQRLRRVDAPLLGVVLNQVTSHGRGYYYYGKHHRYAYSHPQYYQGYYSEDSKET